MVRKSQQYSLIKHLARAVFLSRYSKSCAFAMFTEYSSYFDGSGDKESQPVQVVAGFVSTVKKWARFETDWNALLKANRVSALHMTDYVSSQGEFADWKGDTARRRQFQEALTACMKRNVNKLFASGLMIEDYDAINRAYCLNEFVGSPFAVCGHQSLVKLYRWADRKKLNSKHILAFFENGDKDKGDFQKWAKALSLEWGYSEPGFLPKENAVQFQAADYAAWKYRIALQNARKPDLSIENAARLLESLGTLTSIPRNCTGLDFDSLKQYCEKRGVPRRAEV